MDCRLLYLQHGMAWIRHPRMKLPGLGSSCIMDEDSGVEMPPPLPASTLSSPTTVSSTSESPSL
ncbi:hypothetical protein GALMADRAFT_1321197 [Galerina marginata CBS 339.88]|uniref:Uncharacterized protein n=1 Tax=Galerina marginata (strain CBS 339.88) TaxID=685588 RepID=A0A067S605_GALM3|nr:hypothetical protein GALMADRAFT_1321197 [Galerina marginata CBS 339.88]